MATAQSKKVGEIVEVSEGGDVVRPDGSVVVVSGGSYVLAQPGEYKINGHKVTVE